MKTTGSLILMAFPETFVRPSTEGICVILPYIGIGTKDAVKAGHAALCLVEHATGNIEYYDFGRYITPIGHGRVRNATTDIELHLPIDAVINNGNIDNLDEILAWLHKHPEKTHGDGDLHASVSSPIDFDKAQKYITDLHTRGSIPYGLFMSDGSNCARFVADTFLAATTDAKVKKGMKNRTRLTPSPLGIIYAGSSSGTMYHVDDSGVREYTDFSNRSNWKKFLDRKPNNMEKSGITQVPNSYLLEGVGDSAQFTIQSTDVPEEYSIARYNQKGSKVCEGIFIPTKQGFDFSKDFAFVYDSNCDHCHIEQGDYTYRFNKKNT